MARHTITAPYRLDYTMFFSDQQVPLAQAYGWGVNDADSIAFPDVLQEVSVLIKIVIIRIIVNNNKVSLPVVTPAQCATDVTNVEDGMICAGGVEGESSCIVSS